MQPTEPSENAPAARRPLPLWKLWLPSALILCAAAWFALGSLRDFEEEQRETFLNESHEIENLILQRVHDYELVLRGSQGLLQNTPDIGHARWSEYVQNLGHAQSHPGAQSIGVSVLVPRERLPDHIRARRAETPGYAVRPPGARDSYCPVILLEPLNKSNLLALGFDLYSEPRRREALDRARDTGEACLTGKIALAQDDPETARPACLLFAPVYQAGLPTKTVAERRAALRGFVSSLFRMREFMQGLLEPMSTSLGLELYDGEAAAPEALMYALPAPGPAAAPGFHRQSTVEIYGRKWTLNFTMPRKGWLDAGRREPLGIMLLGVVLAGAVLNITRNIDATRRRAEVLALQKTEELRESESYNRAVFENSSVGISLGGPDDRFLAANPVLQRLLGYSQEELRGLTWADVSHPEDTAQSAQLLAEMKDGLRDSYVIEKRCRRKGGEDVWVRINVGCLRDADGSLRSFVGLYEDISASREAAAASAEREAMYQAMFEGNKCVAILVDGGTGAIVDANDSACAFYGYPREEMRGMPIGRINILPTDVLARRMAEASEQGAMFRFTHRLHDGTLRDVEVRSGPFRSGGRQLLLSTVFDITDRVRAEKALSESRERFRDLVEGMDEGVVLLDAGQDIEFANKALGRMLGLDPADMVDRNVAEFMDTAHTEKLPGLLEARRGGSREPHVDMLRHADGQKLLVRVTPFPLYGQDGSFQGSCGIIRDITAETAAQEAARQRQVRRNALLRLHEMHQSSRQELMDFALEQALVMTGSPLGYICSYDDTSRQFTLHSWSEGVMADCGVANQLSVYQLDQTGVWGDAVRSRKPVLLNDSTAADPHGKDWPEGHAGLARFLTLPVLSAGRVVAVVGVANKQAPYAEEDVTQLTLFTGGLWAIIERQNAEQDLREVTERFHLAVRAGRIGLWDWDLASGAVHCDAVMETLFGITDRDRTGTPEDWICRVHPGDRGAVRRALYTAREEGGRFEASFRVERPGQPTTHLEATALAHLDHQGRPLRMVGVNIDVTRLREAEGALRQSEERFRHLFENAPIPYQSLDGQGRLLLVNAAWLDTLGYTREEVLGRPMGDFLHEGCRDRLAARFARFLAEGVAWGVEWELVRKDGSQLLASFNGRVALDEGGRVQCTHCTFQDITERSRAEEALRQSEERFRTLAQVSPVGIFRSDAEGRATFFNEQWSRITGCAQQTALGHGWIDTLHPEDRERIVAAFRKAAEEGLPFEAENRHRTPAGTDVWVLCRAKAERDAEGRVTGYVGAITDITEQKRAQEALRQAKAEAEAATQAKARFLANMSHEIRTPLAGVIGTTRLLAQSRLDEDQQRLTEMAVESGRALLEVVNDILDFSKIEAGRLAIRPAPFDLRHAVLAVTAPFRVLAVERGLTLDTTLDPALPDILVGDEGRLAQVLRNLLHNALKFTDSGGISLVVAPEPPLRQDADSLLLRVSVSDTGLGIDPGFLPRIFDSFSQADSSYGKQHGGTGLGLAICKNLVEQMGGAIHAVSRPGGGSTFTFTVRLGRAASPPAQAGSRAVAREDAQAYPQPSLQASPGPFATGVKVLLSEDNAIGRTLMEHLLRAAGLAVTSVGDGQAVLGALRGQHFDVVLMDVQMPVMDGLTATRLIRQGEAGAENADIAVVALTAYAGKEDHERFLQGGMDGVVAKPTEEGPLFAAIAHALDTAKARGAGRAAPKEQPPATPGARPDAPDAEAPRFDRGYLRRSFADRQDLLKILLQQFLESSLPEMAGDLRQALASGDLLQGGAVAHRARGSLGAVGALRAAHLAAAADNAAQAGAAGQFREMTEALLAELAALRLHLESGLAWGDSA